MRRLPLILLAGLAAACPGAATAAPRAGGASVAAPLTVVLDPGHDRYPNLGLEPIGPGSSVLKIKDGGGTHGVVSGQSEANVNLWIALRLRVLLRQDGIRVVMTRTRTCCVSHGNIWRARVANRAHAKLFLRIHNDGSTDHAVAGTSTLYPAYHAGWTSDIYRRSLQAARIVQGRLVGTLHWPNRGIVPRSDITGFNWSNVPAVLVEVGFLTNPPEDRALTHKSTIRAVAAGLRRGVLAYLHARGLR